MRADALALLALLALDGCATPPRPDAAPRAQSSFPPPVAFDASAACTLPAGPSLVGAQLRFRHGGPPFALVGARPRASVTVPEGGPAESVLVEGEFRPYRLRGILDELPPLRPQRAFVVGGSLVPRPRARLERGRATAGRVVVRIAVPTDVTLADEQLREVAAPCADVGVEGARFDARAAIVPTSATSRVAAALGARQEVFLLDAPYGVVVAQLGPDARPRVVEVVETSHDHSRVVVTFPDVLLFGWVRTHFLQPTGGHYVDAPEVRGGDPAPIGGPARSFVTCPAPVPLVAEVDGEQRLVGAIDEKTFIGLREERGALVNVTVRYPTVHAAHSASFWVRKATIAPCPGTPDPERPRF